MKKSLLQPWQTVALAAAIAVLAACEPGPPKPKASSAAAVTPAVAIGASPLYELKSSLGSYPSTSNVNFLEQGVLAQRLRAMLGKDYPTLLANLRTVGPLQAEGERWFITGNRPHEGGLEMAAVVIDAPNDAVRVWMLHEGQVTEYQAPQQPAVPWPQAVLALQQQWGGTARAPRAL